MSSKLPNIQGSLPTHKDLFYNGEWHRPKNNGYQETFNPGNGQVIDKISQASAADVDAAVSAAHQAFLAWRSTPPAQRAAYLRQAAELLRQHAEELALIDALNTGN